MARRYLLLSLALPSLLALGCAHGPHEQTARYECDSGRPFSVTYREPDIAVLQMGPRLIEMQAVPTPIGRRYAGTELQLLIQTQDEQRLATLFTRGNNDGPGNVVEQCRETDRD